MGTWADVTAKSRAIDRINRDIAAARLADVLPAAVAIPTKERTVKIELPPLDPAKFWTEAARSRVVAEVTEFIHRAIARLIPEGGPSAVESAPAVTRGVMVYCQSQYDPDE